MTTCRLRRGLILFALLLPFVFTGNRAYGRGFFDSLTRKNPGTPRPVSKSIKAGEIIERPGLDFVPPRYDAFGGSCKSGEVDPTFGVSPKAPNFGLGGTIFLGSGSRGYAIHPVTTIEGDILFGWNNSPAAMNSNPPAPSTAILWRMHSNGSLDQSFGNAGMAISVLSPYGINLATSVASLPDGRTVLGTYVPDFNSPALKFLFQLQCLDRQGNLDPSFGESGIKLTNLTPSANSLEGTTVEFLDGKIWVIEFENARVYALSRYALDGSEESIIPHSDVTDLFRGHHHKNWAVQSDGRVLVIEKMQLKRFDKDALDAGFGEGGVLALKSHCGDSACQDMYYAVNVQSDGKILVAGFFGDDNPREHSPALVRYDEKGNLDLDFKPSSLFDSKCDLQSTQYNPLTCRYLESISDIAVLQDGKILVEGRAWYGMANSSGDYLARYCP